jgi:hypothetical protein
MGVLFLGQVLVSIPLQRGTQWKLGYPTAPGSRPTQTSEDPTCWSLDI